MAPRCFRCPAETTTSDSSASSAKRACRWRRYSTSGACILVAASVSVLTPYAYNYLLGVALFGAITVWIIVLLSHLSFRRHHRLEDLPMRAPLFPGLQLGALMLLCGVLVTMGLDREFWNVSWIVGVTWLMLISVVYFVWAR